MNDDYDESEIVIGGAQIGTIEGNAEITQWWNELLNGIASYIQHRVQEFPFAWDGLEDCLRSYILLQPTQICDKSGENKLDTGDDGMVDFKKFYWWPTPWQHRKDIHREFGWREEAVFALFNNTMALLNQNNNMTIPTLSNILAQSVSTGYTKCQDFIDENADAFSFSEKEKTMQEHRLLVDSIMDAFLKSGILTVSNGVVFVDIND